ncbi:MAG: GNAT family N-acetyltransferase [Flexilinea sp.]|nr:GNAT family N-acetyltransferase [Flexilinea sp.]
MKIEVITKEKLSDYKHLMLSYIYEELEQYEDDLDCEYICLAAMVPNEDGIIIPVSALICLMEPFGDIAILSIYTLPSYRRQGYASELLDKAVFVARRLFIFEEGEDEEDVDLKAVYRLRPEFQEVFEAFLKKNHFTDFVLLDEDDDPQVWAAMAEYRFYKTGSDPEEKSGSDSEEE